MAGNSVPEDVIEKEITKVDVVVEKSELTEDASNSKLIKTVVKHVKEVFKVTETHPSAGQHENKPTEVKPEQSSSSVDTPLEDIRQKYWTKEGYYPLHGFAGQRYVIHFVNEKFDPSPYVKLPERKGASIDLQKIKDIFEKLGFDDWKKSDKREEDDNKGFTKEEIEKCLEDFKLQLHDKACECFLFFISTHGDEQINAERNGQLDHALYCKDTQKVFTSTILKMFNNENCPQLRGKPKIFIIQACRGHEKDEGVEVAVLKDNPDRSGKKTELGTENTDAKASSEPAPAVSNDDATGRAEDVEGRHISVSCYDDMLVMYAIPSKYTAWRNADVGSWMIHYFHNVIEEYENYKTSRPTNFLKLLTEVARRMSKREAYWKDCKAKVPERFKAVPVIEHRLTKHILL